MSWLGGIGRPRPDQEDRPGPRRVIAPGGAAGVLRARRIIVIGAAGGEFVYDAAGNLRSANVGQTTTDPLQGHTCPQGFSTWNGHGAIVNLLSTANAKGAFFQYFDNQSNVQGALILSVASVAGNDPVNATAYPAGLFGSNPVFGDFVTVVGASVTLGSPAFTRQGLIRVDAGAGATSPDIQINAPEQTTPDHLQLLLQGDSPDATHFGQLLIGRVSGAAVLVPATTALVEVQGNATNSPALLLQAAAAADASIASKVAADTNNRYSRTAAGAESWGSGAAARDCFHSRQAAGIMQYTSCDLDIATAGNGLRVKEGANARMGASVLAGGTVVVANTSVTANTRIFLTCETPGGTPGFLRVSARTAGTSFTILSSSGTDTSTVGWLLVEPG